MCIVDADESARRRARSARISRWGSLILVLSSLAATAIVVSLAAAVTSGVSRDGSKDVATSLARSLVARAVLPRGAQPVATPDSGPLTGPFFSEPTPNLVDVSKVWSVPLTMDETSVFLTAHPPAGMANGMCCGRSMTGSTVTSEAVGDAPTATSDPLIASAELLFTVVRSGNRSLVRADAQVVWIAAREANSLIPMTDRVLTVSIDAPPAANRSVTLTDESTVGQVRSALNAFPTAVPGTRSCPLDSGDYRLAFSTSVRSRPDVVANTGPCWLVGIIKDGHPVQTLQADGSFVERIGTLLTVG